MTKRGGFNSRTLGRVRQSSPTPLSLNTVFQFTHPGKGATSTRSIRAIYAIEFQFTHPGKGATADIASTEAGTEFQFTHPGKGATYRFNPFRLLAYQFQFTHPGKGATVWCKVAYYRADKQA